MPPEPDPTTTAIDIADLKARVKQLEDDRDRQAVKIEMLLDFMSGVKMLMYLSIGGGGLSIISLILTITTIIKIK